MLHPATQLDRNLNKSEASAGQNLPKVGGPALNHAALPKPLSLNKYGASGNRGGGLQKTLHYPDQKSEENGLIDACGFSCAV